MKEITDIENEAKTRQTSCGFIALLGAPNAGKSTLLNQIVGQKLAIVTPKAQTTRNRITGACIHDNAQLIFVDVPGVFNATQRFEKAMVECAWSGAMDADITLLIVDAEKGIGKTLEGLLERVKDFKGRISLVLNKIDRVKKAQLLALIERLYTYREFEACYMISALKGDGVEHLKSAMAEALPQGPWLYPEDQLTDLPMRLLASEITREKCFLRLNQELPYSLNVETEKWEERKDGSIAIHQQIYVEREGQKGIVLGKGGSMLKDIGAAARRTLERELDCRVHLFVFVKVKEDWKTRRESYDYLGLKK